MDLDDIWDEPLAPSPPRTAPAAASAPGSPARPSQGARKRTTLFLSSDSEGEGAGGAATKGHYRPRTPKKVPKDIEALFDDLDDVPADDDDAPGELAPALDLDALRRQADARHARAPPLTPHEILPSSSPSRDVDDGNGGGKKGKDDDDDELGGKKKRKPLPKLDEARLLGPQGFPALVKQAKEFKPRGKGHEVSDLNRLLQVYQFWTHRMYPKGTFHDTVQRVEKLCHSKRMHNALGVWSDEAKGLIHGRNPDELHSQDEKGSDSDDDDNTSDKEDRPAAQQRAPSSEAGRDPPEGSHSLPSSPPQRPPSSASEFTSAGPDDDFDIDAMLREEEELARTAPPPAPAKPPVVSQPMAVDDEEDEAMWGELHDLDAPAPAKPPNPPVSAQRPTAAHDDGMDEDEDMWDVVREYEQEQLAQAKPQPSVPQSGQAESTAAAAAKPADSASGAEQQDVPRATNDEGWDEMYL